MEKLVKVIPKNKVQEIRVELKEFKGYNIIDLRIWNTVPNSDEKRPTQKGITLNVSLLPELKEAVALLDKELSK